jgi:HAD superfamily hydrolase (TIGR01458 family)
MMTSVPNGLLIDLDGTVWEDGVLIAGVVETVAALREAGVPFRFLTNTTRKARATLARELGEAGLETAPEEVLTATSSAAAWLRRRGVERVSALVAEAALVDLEGLTIEHEAPEVVLVGDLGEAWTFPVLDRAFRALLAGAELVAVQRNRYWKTGGRLSLDAGPFVVALEYATGQTAHLIGKPSRELFVTAAAELGLEPQRVAMVGDDLEADIEGAKRAGLLAFAVRTGKYRPEDEAGAAAGADRILDSMAELPLALGLA